MGRGLENTQGPPATSPWTLVWVGTQGAPGLESDLRSIAVTWAFA